MKRKYLIAVLLMVTVLLPGRVCFAIRSSQHERTAIGAGVHYHVALTQFEDTEFDDAYLGYLIGAKSEPNNLWTVEAILEYYPSQEDISYILAPRLSLLYGHGFYFGTGIEWKYVELESGESSWSDEAYLFQAGFEVPLSGDNVLNIDAYYGLDKLSDTFEIITDFDSDRVTFGVKLYHYF